MRNGLTLRDPDRFDLRGKLTHWTGLRYRCKRTD